MNSATLLLVDDEPDSLRSLEAALESPGYNLVKVHSGQEALRLLAEQDFTVVLLSMRTPGLDGLETAKQIRSLGRSRHTPILFIAAQEVDRQALEAAYALGPVDHLVKPLVPIVLQTRVAQFVELCKKAEQVKRQAEQLRRMERRQFERTLAESTEGLRAIIDNSPSVIFVKDREGRYLLTNKACEVYSGEPPEYMIGKTDADYLPAACAAQFRADDQRVLETGEVCRYEEQAPIGGQMRTFLTVKFPLRDASGEPSGVCGIATDITELKRAGEALRESETRLRTLSNNLPNGAIYQIVGDSKGWRRFLYISAGIERLFGVTPAEAMADASALYDLILEEDRPRLAAAEEITLRDLTLFDCEFRARCRTGDVRWFHCRSAPRHLASGDVIWEGVILDVTDRKYFEENLARLAADSQRRRRLYEAALSNTPDLVYVLDLSHRFIYANEVLLRLWGKTWDEAIGKNCLELGYEPWLADRHDREIEQVIATKRPVKGEVPFTGTIGRRIYEYIFVPVVGEKGEVEAVAGTTRDVTDRKAQEETLKDQAERLKEADRRKDQFLAMLAHELRNPLAPIKNATQIFRLFGPADPNLERAGEMIERQVQQMSRLVDDLLDVSRITRGKITLHKEPLDLAGVIGQAVEVSRPLIDSRKHELSVSLPREPLRVKADATRLAQVVSNLLNNAAKYTEEGGHIHVILEAKPREAVVRVRDDGIGIPTELLSQVFDLFTQGDRSLARSEGGLGIGLTLVKSLVEMHDGIVEAHSEGPGKGSEFVVRLPRLETESVPAVARWAPRFPPSPGRRVLVVDDNVDAAESLAMVLRAWGHEVETAYDGSVALKKAEQFRPQIVLLDIGLPRIDGYEVACRLREQAATRDAVLVALTGYGQDEDRRRAEDAGFDHHLTKPADLRILQSMLAEDAAKSV
jgi:PAS domain S-box-containing protein